MREIKLKTASMTRIGRLDGDLAALTASACTAAAAGTDPGRVGAVFVASFAPAELCDVHDLPARVAACLRTQYPAFRAPVHGPFRTGGEALYHALTHMQAGDDDVVVIGVEKMTHLDAARSAGLLAPRVSDPVEQRHGATLPALAALATSAYAAASRVPQRAFDAVAVKNHAHAARNPLAQFAREITLDEVAHSPLVADPLRRLHCAPVSDGAAACVLSTQGHGIRVRGWGRGDDAPRFHERTHPGRFRAASRAAAEAFAAAGRSPRDVDVVEIHDAFSPFELMNLEAMGFFPAGEAWRALARDELTIGGRVAVNPSGGMKARGHPIGVCGLTSLAEIRMQLTGSAGTRQQPGARVALIQSAGGVARDCYAFVLESE